MSLTTQFYTMLAMFGMGSWVGAALDTYGRFLKRPLRARWVVFINDFLFWIMQGLILFYLLLLVNEGELRVYIFLAVLCGYAAYQSLLKTIYLRILDRLIQTSISIYSLVINIGQAIIIKPILLLFQVTITILLGILKFLWSLTKWAFQILYSFVKIILAPVWLILRVIWNIIPSGIRNYIIKNINKLAGINKKVKNITNTINIWWQRIKKR
ncbi:spore cortex biosynthesis protein YabQ [Metabacillus litoralis]|uniref:Spore cortex biosynthesis protein YabQ n=1 Tax=Metabacillus litoralis TaxID=152268 RepID=A0A5C6VK69_9BACI|nr:spore cortex biosynthesis protein YabQ [Metabacillus litoralis]TXC85014.1 spore cortex biosynthesis protein YabQ [Metabacillus litoralis]